MSWGTVTRKIKKQKSKCKNTDKKSKIKEQGLRRKSQPYHFGEVIFTCYLRLSCGTVTVAVCVVQLPEASVAV
jgi:hypothetical protein